MAARSIIEFRKQNNYEGRFETTHLLVAERFRLLFLSYSKAFNKAHDRVGSLFQTPFKRCLIDREEKIIRLIFYHHSNPQRHGLCTDFRTYKWTSYPRYLMDSASKLPKAEVFELLGNREQFILCHNELSRDLKEEEEWMIED